MALGQTSPAFVKTRWTTSPVKGPALASLGYADYVDAVAVDVPEGTTASAFAKAALADPPVWLKALLATRARVVASIGLKSPEGPKLGGMALFPTAEDAVIVGEDSDHLSYRIVFTTRVRSNGTREGVCTTVMHFKDLRGRGYFRALWAGHRAVMDGFARNAAKHLSASA